MPSSDAQTLANLQTARDAIIAGMLDGTLTVQYTLGNETHQVQPSTDALTKIEALIAIYTRKASRASQSPFRVASLRRASPRDRCG